MGRRARRIAGDGLAPAGPIRRRSPSFVRGMGEVSTPPLECYTVGRRLRWKSGTTAFSRIKTWREPAVCSSLERGLLRHDPPRFPPGNAVGRNQRPPGVGRTHGRRAQLEKLIARGSPRDKRRQTRRRGTMQWERWGDVAERSSG